MTNRQSALRVVHDQLEQAIAAPKCHVCGCLQQTVDALAATGPGKDEMASVLTQARGIFAPKQYDCLGCPICHPAVAANAFAEAYPDAGAALDLYRRSHGLLRRIVRLFDDVNDALTCAG